MKKYELLAPAGSPEAVEPLIATGADAVYVGLAGYSSRPRSADLDMNEIAHATKLCHDRGVRLHVAANSCISDDAAEGLIRNIKELDSVGVDAVIIADWGILARACEMVRHAEIHASTLLGVYNTATVRFLKELGVRRVVFSTNIYFDEMASTINSVPDMEYEAVADGGICFNDNRICELPHANDGEKYQVFCRLPYELKSGGTSRPANPIASRQITSAEVIDLYMELGITSFKIEGRTVDYLKILPRVQRLRAALDDAVQRSRDNSSTLHYVCTRQNPEVQL